MKVKDALLVAALTAGLSVATAKAEPQQAAKVYRIGYLSPASADAYSVAFSQALRDLG
jgi:hypothetical protein